MGWGKVSLRFHLSPPSDRNDPWLFFFLAHLMTHMINSGLTTLRPTSRGTAPVGVYYLGLSTSCSITQKASWMRGKMRTSEYIRRNAIHNHF